MSFKRRKRRLALLRKTEYRLWLESKRVRESRASDEKQYDAEHDHWCATRDVMERVENENHWRDVRRRFQEFVNRL